MKLDPTGLSLISLLISQQIILNIEKLLGLPHRQFSVLLVQGATEEVHHPNTKPGPNRSPDSNYNPNANPVLGLR